MDITTADPAAAPTASVPEQPRPTNASQRAGQPSGQPSGQQAGQLGLDDAILAAFMPESRHDPYPAYQVLRASGPLVASPFGLWIVPGYAEVEAILQDPAWSHASEPDFLHPSSDGSDLPASFLWMEPPDHTRLRRLVSKAFTARGLEPLRRRVREVVRELVDGAIRDGEIDVVDRIAYPLPLTMICELVGVPASDHDFVRSSSYGIARGLDPDILLSREELDARVTGARAFRDYFAELVARRRADPRDDLVTALAQVEAEGDRLTTDEMIATLTVLLIAGHETTVNLVANGLLALIRHPDQYRLLQSEPDLAPFAVDELMRFDPPSHVTTRMATRDLEVAGHAFAKGDGVLLLFASANRDARMYAEPDRLDLARFARGSAVPRHVGFGVGLHYCIGAPLVRMEMEALLRELAHRAPRLTPLVDPPPYRPNIVVRGIREFPVRFDA